MKHALISAAILLLSGCLGGGDVTGTDAPSGDPTETATSPPDVEDRTSEERTSKPAEPPQVSWFNDTFRWTVGAHNPTTGYSVSYTDFRSYVWTDFPENVFNATFTAKWTCTSTPLDCPLKVVLWGPENCCDPYTSTPDHETTGDVEATIDVQQPRAGSWTMQFYSQAAVDVGVSGETTMIVRMAASDNATTTDL